MTKPKKGSTWALVVECKRLCAKLSVSLKSAEIALIRLKHPTETERLPDFGIRVTTTGQRQPGRRTDVPNGLLFTRSKERRQIMRDIKISCYSHQPDRKKGLRIVLCAVIYCSDLACDQWSEAQNRVLGAFRTYTCCQSRQSNKHNHWCMQRAHDRMGPTYHSSKEWNGHSMLSTSVAAPFPVMLHFSRTRIERDFQLDSSWRAMKQLVEFSPP